MPNWCHTSYTFYTDTEKGREQLADFYNKLTASVSGKHLCIVKSDFGDKWLGNVINAFTPQYLTTTPDNVKCTYENKNISFRGSVVDIDDNNETDFSLSTETAWEPMPEMWNMIIEACGYTDVKYVYEAEESCNGLFVTNDKEGRYYDDKYYVEINIDEDFYEYESNYLPSAQSCLEYLNEIIDGMRDVYSSNPDDFDLPEDFSLDNLKRGTTINEAIAIIENNLPDNDDAYISVNKFEIVD